MPAQLKKNFIGIVSDQTEEQRVVEWLEKSNLRDRIADALTRQSEAGQSSPPQIGRLNTAAAREMQNEMAELPEAGRAHALPIG
jgi:hypothetical protein